MGEFIFNRGRSKTAHSYPDTRPGANSPPGGAFARNFAFGPSGESLNISDAGTEVTWGLVDVPGTDPEDVPITPRVTGKVHVEAVFSLINVTTSPVDIQAQILIDGATQTTPANEQVTVPASDGEGANGYAVIPVMVDFELPIGATYQISFFLTAETGQSNNVLILVGSSTAAVEEVQASTG